VSRRIGIVGDTHVPEAGSDLPLQAYRALEGCEHILHCGDLHTLDVVDRLELVAPTLVSRGNGDRRTPRAHQRSGVPDDPRVHDNVFLEVAPFRLAMSHDLAHVETLADDDVVRLLHKRFGADVDIAVSGHTHVPMLRGLDSGVALVNPGSPTMPHGYPHRLGTLALLDVDDERFTVTVLDLESGDTALQLHGPGAHPLTHGRRPADAS
jgi:putative phosphoesterase